MIHNKTIDAQLNHRSIRKFKDTTLNKEQLETLYSVFAQTPTSMFMQNASLIHIIDPEQKKKLENYVIKNMLVQKVIYSSLSLIYIVINKLENNLARMMVVCILLISFSKQWKIPYLPTKMSLMP